MPVDGPWSSGKMIAKYVAKNSEALQKRYAVKRLCSSFKNHFRPYPFASGRSDKQIS